MRLYLLGFCLYRWRPHRSEMVLALSGCGIAGERGLDIQFLSEVNNTNTNKSQIQCKCGSKGSPHAMRVSLRNNLAAVAKVSNCALDAAKDYSAGLVESSVGIADSKTDSKASQGCALGDVLQSRRCVVFASWLGLDV